MSTDDGTTTNIAEYFEYHIPYQPTSLGIGSIVEVLPQDAYEGVYPPECILITSNESTSQGFSNWYLGLLPSNLEMLNKSYASTHRDGAIIFTIKNSIIFINTQLNRRALC